MRKIDKLKNILKINESIQIDNKQLNENENGFGTNLRSLLDGEIAIAMKNMDLNNYNERNNLIDKIEARLMSGDWISMSNGLTFTKSFDPKQK